MAYFPFFVDLQDKKCFIMKHIIMLFSKIEKREGNMR